MNVMRRGCHEIIQDYNGESKTPEMRTDIAEIWRKRTGQKVKGDEANKKESCKRIHWKHKEWTKRHIHLEQKTEMLRWDPVLQNVTDQLLFLLYFKWPQSIEEIWGEKRFLLKRLTVPFTWEEPITHIVSLLVDFQKRSAEIRQWSWDSQCWVKAGQEKNKKISNADPWLQEQSCKPEEGRSR